MKFLTKILFPEIKFFFYKYISKEYLLNFWLSKCCELQEAKKNIKRKFRKNVIWKNIEFV